MYSDIGVDCQQNASEHNFLKEDIESLTESMSKIEQTFLFFKEERNYLRKNKYMKSRKLVLYRQMILTTNRALYTLKVLHRLENDMHHMPKSFQDLIASELDHLVNYHEQILLKFIGKIKSHNSLEIAEEACTCKKRLLDTVLQYQRSAEEDNNDTFYQLFPLLATIIDYSDQLTHLDKLIESFHSYHKDENHIEINEKFE